MPANRNALIRYLTLDKCFSNRWRKCYIEDLVEACNEALKEFVGENAEVKKRQIYDDIRYMESEQGWSIPLERIKDGRKVYYRYSNPDFSIKNSPIKSDEIELIINSLTILRQLNGIQNFDFIDDLLIKLETNFKVKHNDKPIVFFEQNPFLKGLNLFKQIFDSIVYKKVLSITYTSYRSKNTEQFIIHPYILKEYRKRWFLFGYNERYKDISTLALDRIKAIEEVRAKYIENTFIDFDEYFEDLIGVTKYKNSKLEKIQLWIDNSLYPYIESKPLHGSQKLKQKNGTGTIIEITTYINNELISLLLSYGEKIKILSPEKLKNIVKDKIIRMLKNYS